MADQTIPELTESLSRADTDEVAVHRSGQTRAERQKSSTFLSGLLRGLTIRKNSGADVGSQARLNLIEGTNVTLTVTNDAGNGEVDVTITSTASGSPTEVWARVRKNATQSISATSETALTWETEDADTNTFHSTVSSTPRFTIPSGQAGRYLIECSIRFSTSVSGQRNAYIRKNGSTMLAGATAPGISGVNTYLNVQCVVDLAVADYVEVAVYSTVGIDVVADEASHFVIRKLS